jgi:magnesium-transporting ATPase (P-type)
MMEKVKFAPMNPINYETNVQEFTKEELEEAGIIIDYIDEEHEMAKVLPKYDEKKMGKWKHYMRWMLLVILIFFVAIIIGVGMVQMNRSERELATEHIQKELS